VLSHLITNISKSRTPYRFHIGSFEEKLRREDDDLMTSACSFNGGKTQIIMDELFLYRPIFTYIPNLIGLKQINPT